MATDQLDPLPKPDPLQARHEDRWRRFAYRQLFF